MTGALGGIAHARVVADAVLYEGYLLYPYRASSGKNQSRWQFGVLGPPGALEAGVGEDAVLASQFLVRHEIGRPATVTVHLRFLHLQRRCAQRLTGSAPAEDVAELVVGERRWLSWDEAVEQDLATGTWPVEHLDTVLDLDVPASEDVETVTDDGGSPAGRLVRRRRPLRARLRLQADEVAADLCKLSVHIENVTADVPLDQQRAIAASLIGAHLLVSVESGEFVSMTDPPSDAVEAAAGCHQHRCWPVLAGPPGDRSLMLVSPIILYDHPEIAPQSAGALYDSTEIDEILTLRIMTLTDEEKAAARATDPRAAEIIDRCDAMSPEAMQQLHGVLRDPHALTDVDLSGSFGFDGDVPWWDPAVDGSVSPGTDAALVNGIAVTAGSIVRIHPSRRADAQDLFFADQVARVTAVHSDVDGETHVAVVLVDDPAADLHDWYGRYLYFAPDELEPLPALPPSSPDPDHHREESRS